MQDRRREAAAELHAAIADLTYGRCDLLQFMRRCLDACTLAGLVDDAAWFRIELTGYSAADAIPNYRHGIVGSIGVESDDPMAATFGSSVRYANQLTGTDHPDLDRPRETVTRFARMDLAGIIRAAREGLAYQEGEPIVVNGRFPGAVAYYHNVVRIVPSEFQRLEEQIRVAALARARNAETIVTFGDAVEDVWEGLRSVTDEALIALGLGDYVESIRNNIRSDNPEDWRAAMWSCRSVLERLSEALWQDPQSTYPPLKGSDGQPLSVTHDKKLNRLLAYLHYKGVTGKTRNAIDAELKLLMGSLHGLYGLDSKAHDGEPVSRHDAVLAVVTTYTTLSQLALRTDLQPVTDQTNSPVEAAD